MLTTSKWHTRAWCYQEEKLSRRLLIFTPSQVFFTCQSASFCESIDYSGHKKENVDPFFTQRDSQEWSWPSYTTKLHEYTARSLSYEDDVLNAFAGVLTGMQRTSLRKIVAGIPEDDIVRGTLWQPGKPMKRRPHRRFPFPSFSWIGWVGPAGFESCSYWTEHAIQEWFYRDSANKVTSLGNGQKKNIAAPKDLGEVEIFYATAARALEDDSYDHYLN